MCHHSWSSSCHLPWFVYHSILTDTWSGRNTWHSFFRVYFRWQTMNGNWTKLFKLSYCHQDTFDATQRIAAFSAWRLLLAYMRTWGASASEYMRVSVRVSTKCERHYTHQIGEQNLPILVKNRYMSRRRMSLLNPRTNYHPNMMERWPQIQNRSSDLMASQCQQWRFGQNSV